MLRTRASRQWTLPSSPPLTRSSVLTSSRSPSAGCALSPKPTPTGIAALDDLLGKGGFWTGASTLVAGPTGIGKTLMGLHFLYRGAEVGEPGILATSQENLT